MTLANKLTKLAIIGTIGLTSNQVNAGLEISVDNLPNQVQVYRNQLNDLFQNPNDMNINQTWVNIKSNNDLIMSGINELSFPQDKSCYMRVGNLDLEIPTSINLSQNNIARFQTKLESGKDVDVLLGRFHNNKFVDILTNIGYECKK